MPKPVKDDSEFPEFRAVHKSLREKGAECLTKKEKRAFRSTGAGYAFMCLKTLNL